LTYERIEDVSHLTMVKSEAFVDRRSDLGLAA